MSGSRKRVSTKKIAAIAGVSGPTIRSWRLKGLPHERDSRGRLWFDPVAVREWLEEHGRGSKPGTPGLGLRIRREQADKRNGVKSLRDAPGLKAAPAPTPVVTAEDLAAARLRKELALAEKHEIQIAKLKAELLDAGDVERDRVRRVQVVKARLLQLPMTAAPLCAGRDEAEIQRIIEVEVRQLLEDFARGERDE